MANISIIMPSYNNGKYIEKTIQSVLQQTYRDFELIVVDDGSTDDTATIVHDLMKKYSSIRYIFQNNKGVSAARNSGIKFATGKYIAFLDADDLWEKTILEKLIQKIQSQKQNNYKFVYGRTKEIFEDGKAYLIGPKENIEGELSDFLYKTNELRLTFHISAILVEASLIKNNKILFQEGIKISEDTGFFIQLLCLTKVYCVPEVLSYYIRHTDSTTTRPWQPNDWIGQVDIYDRLNSFIRQCDDNNAIVFYKMKSYVAYRFILKTIRHGYINEGQQYIFRWKNELNTFLSSGRWNDRIKCYIMIKFCKSKKILQLLQKI